MKSAPKSKRVGLGALGVSVGVALGISPEASQGGVVPWPLPAQFQGQYQEGPIVVPINSSAPINESGSNWIITQEVTPSPTVTTTASGVPGVYSGIYYYVALVGPNSVSVPVTISGTFMATGSGPAFNSEAQIRFYDYRGTALNDIIWNCYIGSLECGASSYSYTIDVVPSPSIENLSLSSVFAVLPQASSSTDPYSYSFATTDPHIYVASSVPDAGEYALVLSPGIGNAAATVPEAPTWTMLLTGFVGLGFAAFRRWRESDVGFLRQSTTGS